MRLSCFPAVGSDGFCQPGDPIGKNDSLIPHPPGETMRLQIHLFPGEVGRHVRALRRFLRLTEPDSFQRLTVIPRATRKFLRSLVEEVHKLLPRDFIAQALTDTGQKRSGLKDTSAGQARN